MVFVTSCHSFRRYTGHVDHVKRRGRVALPVTTQDASGAVAGQLAISEHGPSVDDDMRHPDRKLIRFKGRPPFTEGRVVEDGDVCEGTGRDDAPVPQANSVGRCSAEPVNGLRRAQKAGPLDGEVVEV